MQVVHANPLPDERFAALRRAWLDGRERGETLIPIAESVPALIATVLVRQQLVESAIATLPDSAFEPQPPGPDGTQRWTAGQVADHLCASRRLVSIPALAALVTGGDARPLPGAGAPPRPLRRSAAAAELARSGEELAVFLAEVPVEPDLRASVEHPLFGRINLPVMLLLTAMHENGHLRQLRELR